MCGVSAGPTRASGWPGERHTNHMLVYSALDANDNLRPATYSRLKRLPRTSVFLDFFFLFIYFLLLRGSTLLPKGLAFDLAPPRSFRPASVIWPYLLFPRLARHRYKFWFWKKFKQAFPPEERGWFQNRAEIWRGTPLRLPRLRSKSQGEERGEEGGTWDGKARE